ncbi:YtxH domain-containing protein [Halalkalibacterium ligniniphilum]|uniref:YtxH domain-containing protein n=1 Tax=Halalkalibacterium ligniniphilum TaxID=1134413 RepID=UPI00034D1CFA|nr:YtxH domain-containing protein [Halalkalibacterium ligniniphilum]
MFRQNHKRSNDHFLAGVLIGGMIGTASALLFAPERGKVMKQNVQKQWNAANKGGEIGNKWMGHVRHIISNQTKKTAEPATNGSIPSAGSSGTNELGKIIHEVLESEQSPK